MVLNQLIFKILDILVFQPNAASRAREILGEDVSFDSAKFEAAEIVRTHSVNSAEVLNLVRRVRPEVVVVSGVSILGNDLLDLLHDVPYHQHPLRNYAKVQRRSRRLLGSSERRLGQHRCDYPFH